MQRRWQRWPLLYRIALGLFAVGILLHMFKIMISSSSRSSSSSSSLSSYSNSNSISSASTITHSHSHSHSSSSSFFNELQRIDSVYQDANTSRAKELGSFYCLSALVDEHLVHNAKISFKPPSAVFLVVDPKDDDAIEIQAAQLDATHQRSFKQTTESESTSTLASLRSFLRHVVRGFPELKIAPIEKVIGGHSQQHSSSERGEGEEEIKLPVDFALLRWSFDHEDEHHLIREENRYKSVYQTLEKAAKKEYSYDEKQEADKEKADKLQKKQRLLSELGPRVASTLMIYGHRSQMSPMDFFPLMERYPYYRIHNTYDMVTIVFWVQDELNPATTATTYAYRPPECSIGVHYAIVATNDKIEYSFYLPLIASVWYHVMGYNLIVHYSGAQWKSLQQAYYTQNQQQEGNEQQRHKLLTTMQSDDAPSFRQLKLIFSSMEYHRKAFGLVLNNFFPEELMELGKEFDITASQASRVFAAANLELHDDDFVIQADADIMPVNYAFFHLNYNWSKSLHLINSFCCGEFEFQDRRNNWVGMSKVTHYPMSYVAGSVRTWREVIGFDRSKYVERQSILVRGGQKNVELTSGVWDWTVRALDVETDEYWTKRKHRKDVESNPSSLNRFWWLDELLLSRRVAEWEGHPSDCDFIPSIWGRIDRINWHPDAPLITDSHGLKMPHMSDVWPELRRLVVRLVPSREMQRIDKLVASIQQYNL
eukprot:TRINITY_DN1570_c0_g1_i1.p1 TRINITY_DN1570_c0_g1~~TRINITY_DN1570_c0_g1_i1.p1  ORF type:complete len:716 (-),score=152.73 TRINITY_DN1570_c0_g1_i1:74-2200(-)